MDVDEAMADVLGEQSVEGRVVGDSLEQPTDDLDMCTADEARELVEQARSSLTNLDKVMGEMVRRRAWVPLGYESPERFWLAEFNQPTANSIGGYSRAHMYRTARLLGLIYGLVERIGDDAYAIDVTERALRAIPRSRDEALIEDVAQRLAAHGEQLDAEGVQEAFEAAVSNQRGGGRDSGAASRWDDPDDDTDDEQMVDSDDLAERLRVLGLGSIGAADPDTTPTPGASETGSGSDTDTQMEDTSDEDTNVGVDLEQATSGRLSKEEAAMSFHISNLQRGIQFLAALADDNLPNVIAALSHDQRSTLRSHTDLVRDVLTALDDSGDDDDVVDLSGL